MFNFKRFFLTESILSDYKYVLPTDKEQLFFDFYMLAFVDQVGQALYRTDEDEADGEAALSQTRKVLLPFLQRELLFGVLTAIDSEIKHLPAKTKEYGYGVSIAEFRKTDDKYKSIKNGIFAFGESHPKSLSAIQLFKTPILICRDAFKELKWFSDYGGKMWANICEAWLKLLEANSTSELYIWIDHIYDIQHNTDSVFDKIQEYYKDSDKVTWLMHSLGYKANVKTPWQIYPNCSYTMKEMARFILRAKKFDPPDKLYTRKDLEHHRYVLKNAIIGLKNEEVKDILDRIPIIFDPKRDIKELIYYAVSVGNIEAIKMLEEKMPEWEKSAPKQGIYSVNGFFHTAFYNHHWEVAKFFIEKGADWKNNKFGEALAMMMQFDTKADIIKHLDKQIEKAKE